MALLFYEVATLEYISSLLVFIGLCLFLIPFTKDEMTGKRGDLTIKFIGAIAILTGGLVSGIVWFKIIP